MSKKKPLISFLDHIEFVVDDVEEFVKFFETWGFEVSMRSDHHHGSAEMNLPDQDLVIEIHGVEGEENPGINHLAWATDNIEECAKVAKEKGYKQVGEPRLYAPTGRMLLNFRDPDGFRFQLTSTQRVEPKAGVYDQVQQQLRQQRRQ